MNHYCFGAGREYSVTLAKDMLFFAAKKEINQNYY